MLDGWPTDVDSTTDPPVIAEDRNGIQRGEDGELNAGTANPRSGGRIREMRGGGGTRPVMQ